jgi:ABC-type nickel/cobalt efflux system permease component RcnA
MFSIDLFLCSSLSLSLSLFQLLDVIFRDATLFQVTQSLTRNGKSIMLTMFLALVLIYHFSLLGFLCFRDDFIHNVQQRNHSSNSHRYRHAGHSFSKPTIRTRTSHHHHRRRHHHHRCCCCCCCCCRRRLLLLLVVAFVSKRVNMIDNLCLFSIEHIDNIERTILLERHM